MAYLGPPPSQKLATPTSQYFSGNGSATAFTLNRPVNVAEDLNVFVNNVAQQPGSGKSYTATGTTLTFDAAPDAGTNNVYVVYRGLAEPTTRLEHPSGQPLAATTGTFSGAFTSPGIDDNADATAVTISSGELVGIGEPSPTSALHIKGGAGTNLAIQSTAGTHWRIGDGVGSTNGNLVIYDYTDSRKVLEIDTLGRVTMPNQPAFLARRNGTGLQLNNEIMPFDSKTIYGGFDTASGYNTSTYTYTCPIAGLYWFHVSSILGSVAVDNGQWKIQLNGSDYEQRHFTNKTTEYYTHSIDTYINASANDTVRVKMSSNIYTYGNQWSVFMGHLIG